MKITIISKERILIILSILFSKSLYYETFGENYLLIPFLGLTGLYVIFLSYNNKFFISKSSILLYITIIVAILINPNFANSTFLVFFTTLTIALLCTASIPFVLFATTFFHFLKFIMIISLLKYLFLFSNISAILPDFISITGDHYLNFIFFGIFNEEGIFLNKLRNNGIWWEPGAFQVFINLAFMFGILLNKITKWNYLLFLIVILSTLSTAGALIFSILSFIYFRRIKKTKILFIVLLIIIPIISTSKYYEIVFLSKINMENASSKSRYNDATLAIKMFLNNPIIGTGFGDTKTIAKYKRTNSYGTGSNGILLLLANMGLLSFIILIPVFSPNYFNGLGNLEKYLASISLFLIFFTQNFTIILIFSILLFYGVKNYHLNNQKNRNFNINIS